MKLHMKLRASLFVGLFTMIAGSYLSMTPAVAADAYPNKPITLIVPFSAGGPTDAVARLIAVPMGKDLGQTVIVENTVVHTTVDNAYVLCEPLACTFPPRTCCLHCARTATWALHCRAAPRAT